MDNNIKVTTTFTHNGIHSWKTSRMNGSYVNGLTELNVWTYVRIPLQTIHREIS